MTDPEQGTGPPDHAPKMPPGWIDRGDGIARPNPADRLYPLKKFMKRERAEFARLDKDRETQEALTQIRGFLWSQIERLNQIRGLLSEDSGFDDRAIEEQLVTRFFHVIRGTIDATLDQTPPHPIPRLTRAHYLFRALLIEAGYSATEVDDMAAGAVGPRAAPTLLANFTTEDHPIGATIPRGGFLMIFTHASRADRLAFDPLIAAAQRHLGTDLYRDVDGRTKLEDRPETSDLAAEADKLINLQGLEPLDVSRRLGLFDPTKIRQTNANRVKRLAKAGKRKRLAKGQEH